jgi:hypothetical protein
MEARAGRQDRLIAKVQLFLKSLRISLGMTIPMALQIGRTSIYKSIGYSIDRRSGGALGWAAHQ